MHFIYFHIDIQQDLASNSSIVSGATFAGLQLSQIRWRENSIYRTFLGKERFCGWRRSMNLEVICLHPGRLTWNLKITQLKGKSSSKPSFSGSMLIFQGVRCLEKRTKKYDPKWGSSIGDLPMVESKKIVFNKSKNTSWVVPFPSNSGKWRSMY